MLLMSDTIEPTAVIEAVRSTVPSTSTVKMCAAHVAAAVVRTVLLTVLPA